MIKDIEALLTQPYNMFYTLMMWLSFALASYFGTPESKLAWSREYPLISMGLFGLLMTLLITAYNTIPFARRMKHDRIISYILFMLTAFLLYKAAHDVNLLFALGAASGLWMGLEQGRNRLNNNISSTKEFNL